MAKRGRTRAGGSDSRILIVSASVGAGHDGVANELARRLRTQGFRVDCVDFLDLLPGFLGRALRQGYALELRAVPRTWDWLYTALERYRWLAAAAGGFAALALRRMRRLIGDDCVAVVSTYPLASQVLGRLRRNGDLRMPVATVLCDMSVHRLWVHAHVDVHLALHAVPAGQARDHGARSVVVVAPLVAAGFAPPASGEQRALARSRFSLPPAGRLVLLLAGSWGVGDVERAARDVAASGLGTPVVVCGHNTALHGRLVRHGVGIPLGWVQDMPGLLRAVDVVVHNAGGLSCMEALATGVPVLTYRCIPGHGRTNVAALDQAGLAARARNPDELSELLDAVMDGPLRAAQHTAAVNQSAGPDPADVIASLAPAPPNGKRRPWPTRRLVRVASVAAICMWVCIAGPSLAVEYGIDAVRPGRAPASVFFIIEPSADRALTTGEVDVLAQSHIAVAVSDTLLHRQPDSLRAAVSAGVMLVNAGAGAPYETGLVAGRASLGSTASSIGRLTGTVPSLLLSNGDLDAIDLATAARHHERIVVPNLTLDCASPVDPPRGGVIILLRSAIPSSCDLTQLLPGVRKRLSARSLRPASLREVIR